jgi:hypothetical protein
MVTHRYRPELVYLALEIGWLSPDILYIQSQCQGSSQISVSSIGGIFITMVTPALRTYCREVLLQVGGCFGDYS